MSARRVMVMRCDASAQLGFGHASRCLAIADAARTGQPRDVVFAMTADALGVALVAKRGYRVVTRQALNEAEWLDQVVESENASVLVLDVRTDLSADAIEAIHARGVTVVTIDDGSDRRLKADLAFYPPVPQLQTVSWAGFGGHVYSGWEWIPLRSEIAAAREHTLRPPSASKRSAPTVLVTMGASDPAGLTIRALEALDNVQESCNVEVLIGPAFLHPEALAAFFRRARGRYDVRTDVADIAAVTPPADLAIASFGVTAYELAALGVPALHLCLTEDHAESARALEAVGASRNLGVHDRVKPVDIAAAITDLLRNPKRRAEMGRCAAKTIDGRGAQRIADLIEEHTQRSHGVA